MGPFPSVTDERIELCHFTAGTAVLLLLFDLPFIGGSGRGSGGDVVDVVDVGGVASGGTSR